MKEKPGAHTPWTEINQLLAPDERFEVSQSNQQGFLLAPKHSSQLAALLYLICRQGVPFSVQGRGTSVHPNHSLIISARAFSQLIFHEKGVVEVGAGCPLSHLHQFLFERKREIPLEEDPLSSPKQSIAGLLLSGKTSGICYHQESALETILGIEMVTFEGSRIIWGGHQKSALAGPTLHKLIWGLNSIPAIIVKIILKTYPIPQKRLRLTWSFRDKDMLRDHFLSLKNFSCTWESLEWVLSGQKTEQGFIFAQISGLETEMEGFSQLCPGYPIAQQHGEKIDLKNFLKQKRLQAYSVSADQLLEPGEYLWHQALNKKTLLMTHHSLNEKNDSRPLWKERFAKF
jgi:hypothetical protein